LREIEKPHLELHQSAIEIKKLYRAADSHLPELLAEVEIAHLNWAAGVRDSLIKQSTSLDVEKDYTRCGLAKWLQLDSSKKTLLSIPVFRTLLRK